MSRADNHGKLIVPAKPLVSEVTDCSTNWPSIATAHFRNSLRLIGLQANSEQNCSVYQTHLKIFAHF